MNDVIDPAVNKSHLKKGFTKYAQQYDAYANIQKQVADYLFDLASPAIQLLQPEDLALDLGCGTGYCVGKAIHANTLAKWLGVDISEGMLEQARENIQHAQVNFELGDIEMLPTSLPPSRLIISSLALQWVNDLSRAFNSIANQLLSGGDAFIATLQTGTIHELSDAWSQIDRSKHVLGFKHFDEICTAAKDSGLQIVRTEQVSFEDKFSNPMDAIKSIKEIGAGNHLNDQKTGLTSASKFKQMLKVYTEIAHQNGKYQNTYGAVFLHLKKL